MWDDELLGDLGDAWPQQAHDPARKHRSDRLGSQEREDGRGRDPGECVGQGARHGHGRVGEARRGGEETGAGDVGAHGERCRAAAAAPDDAEDDEQQAKGRDHLAEPQAVRWPTRPPGGGRRQ